jgi:nucleoid DNA-binding protein
MTKANNKTVATKKSVASYIKTLGKVERAQAKQLIGIFTDVIRTKPVMWGPYIVGFGSYHYKYASGREGDYLATGFAIRTSGPTIYIMPGYKNYGQILKTLGPHKLGKGCLYIKSLEDISIPTLKKLIRAGLADLKKMYPVTM